MRQAVLRAFALSLSVTPVACVANLGASGDALDGSLPPDTGANTGGANSGGSAGRTGSGGTTNAGGTTGTSIGGGNAGKGGATSSIGGSAGKGGATASGGSAGKGDTTGSGGAAGKGGATGTGGAVSTTGKFVGNITTNGAVRAGFVTYWNQISPENEGKWGSVQSAQGSFNWTALDRIYAYAQSNNIVFKEHNFIWGSQQPNWVNNGNAQAAVQAWMKAFCTRYPNTKLIDVVNEPPPHTTPAYINGMGGAGTSGFDWIVNAFKWARAACPNAILILNDFNNIEFAADNARTIDIVNRIKAAGAPIDAVGAQAHAAYSTPTSTVKAFLDKITSSTGLPVYITEYDIPQANDNTQKTTMQDQMTMFWNDNNVKGITLWGYIVGSTWKDNTGLQQTNGTLRPAMSWLMSFLGR